MTRHFRIGLFVALSGLVGLHVRPFIGCAVDALLGRADLASCAALDAVASAPAGVALAGAFRGVARDGGELVAAAEPAPVSVRPALCVLAAEARALPSPAASVTSSFESR